MPDVEVDYPEGMLDDITNRLRFKRDVKGVVARGMDCIKPPEEGEPEVMTRYAADPDGNVGLLLRPYKPEDGSDIWTPIQVRISTYAWPDRMANLDDRIWDITQDVRRLLNVEVEEFLERMFPGKTKLVAVRFDPKFPGAWAEA
jgi:hypothetical protein